jgi:predicted esterase
MPGVHRQARQVEVVIVVRVALVFFGITATALPACRDREDRAARPGASVTPVVIASAAAPPAAASSAPAPWEPPHDAEVEQIEVPGDLPAFIVRGRPGGERMVFLHGLCGNPYAYAWSFRNAAARLGTIIAIQGNVPCSGEFRDWASTPEKVDARIQDAFRAAGDDRDLVDLVVMGYSSGATYAELLVMKNPQRYARAVLIANPRKPASFRLRDARAVVLMAGQLDRQDLMQAGLLDLKAAHVPATFMVLPGATHGEMGPESERVMREALAWLLEHKRPAGDSRP